ncbi:hypothetical protein QOZ80_8AG0639360 [Eleusine coracana subsp. coracana]|nr:hypothetical protein QOZ80_8AG0639360 [Eleusine coracana subsp. coracana]
MLKLVQLINHLPFGYIHPSLSQITTVCNLSADNFIKLWNCRQILESLEWYSCNLGQSTILWRGLFSCCSKHWFLNMDRLRRITGMGKAKAPAAVQKEKDESIVFFRELYKREKDRDVNLLEPMYSVEFDAIQGGHVSKVPSGKRDFLIPVDDKHDYDWLKSTPATPLFPSLEMKASSSQMVFQKEPLIPPRQVKPSTSRVSGRPEAIKTSARPASPTVNSSSNRTFVNAAPAIPKEKNQRHTVDKRSSLKVPMNGQQKAVAAAPRSSGTTKKHSERCYASQTCSTSAVKGVTEQDFLFKAPKNLITSGPMFRRHVPSADRARTKIPGFGADVKKENCNARRQSCPPAARRGIKEQQLEGRQKQNVLTPRGREESAWSKGTRITHGKKEQRPEPGTGIQAKK